MCINTSSSTGDWHFIVGFLSSQMLRERIAGLSRLAIVNPPENVNGCPDGRFCKNTDTLKH
jgi:hypothetical protein